MFRSELFIYSNLFNINIYASDHERLIILRRKICIICSQIKTRLLEHMALLEGMLDRLRYFCIETSNINCKRMQLTDRMCRATSRFVISLLRILLDVDVNTRTPLLWHDVLLNSVTVNEMTNTLHRSLQQMCQLFDELDTKSTNL